MWAACIRKGRDLHALSVFPVCIYWSSKAASAGNLRRLPCFLPLCGRSVPALVPVRPPIRAGIVHRRLPACGVHLSIGVIGTAVLAHGVALRHGKILRAVVVPQPPAVLREPRLRQIGIGRGIAVTVEHTGIAAVWRLGLAGRDVQRQAAAVLTEPRIGEAVQKEVRPPAVLPVVDGAAG